MTTPLVYEKFAGGWPAALIVVAIAVAAILWCLDDTARERRRHRAYAGYVDRVITAAEVAHVIPADPESPDVTRPYDLDDCSGCFGTGMVERTGLHGEQWVTCGLCGGSGERVA